MVDISKGAPSAPQEFKGYLATATLHPDRVEIKRKFMAKVGGNKDASIPLADVIKVLSKEPTRLVNGFVFLATAADPPQLRALAAGTEKQVAGNKHTIMFTWQQRDAYAAALAAVDTAWRAAGPQFNG